MLNPEEIEADEATAAQLLAVAALAGTFWDALRACGLPDHLAIALVRDWHLAVIADDPVEWSDLGEDE
jgi:hypothetical protein